MFVMPFQFVESYRVLRKEQCSNFGQMYWDDLYFDACVRGQTFVQFRTILKELPESYYILCIRMLHNYDRVTVVARNLHARASWRKRSEIKYTIIILIVGIFFKICGPDQSKIWREGSKSFITGQGNSNILWNIEVFVDPISPSEMRHTVCETFEFWQTYPTLSARREIFWNVFVKTTTLIPT